MTSFYLELHSRPCFPQVLAVVEQLVATAVCSRSFIAADVTTAVPEFDLSVRGAHSLQVMIKINCTDIAEDEKVKNK